MQGQRAQIVELVEYHLVTECCNSYCQAPIRIKITRFKEVVIFGKEIQKHQEQKVCSVTKVGEIVVPPHMLVINKLAENEYRKDNRVIIIVKFVREAPEDESLPDDE